MTATLPPAFQELYSQFLSLSQEEQDDFREQVDATPTDREERDRAVLEHRERLFAEGLTQYVPWEQAKKEMRASLRIE